MKRGTLGFGGPVALGFPDLPKTAIFLITLALLTTAKRLPEPVIVLGAAVAGLVLFPMLHP